MDEMILDIENFGSINEAHIKLGKLNIIAGVNGSGKSISSKLLFCFLTATSKERYFLSNNSIYERFVQFILYWHGKISFNQPTLNLNGMLTLIEDNFGDKSFDMKRIDILEGMIESLGFQCKEKFVKELEGIKNLLQFNGDHYYRYFNVLLNSEFNFSELKDYKKAHVKFHGSIDDCKFTHEIDFNGERIGAKINEGYVDCLNFEDVVYIDSPSIFDFKNEPNKNTYHLNHLSKSLYSGKNENEYLHNKFNELIDGNIYYDFKKQDFVFKQGDNEHSMKNTASGIKQIGVIQLLLENRNLKENSFLFIDGPEINLHPEWQVKLAELLVLLVKELNIYLYINSHSPQFIEALEVFCVKYGIISESKFYLSKKLDNNKFKFEEIAYDNLVTLYNNLGDSYDIIDEIRAENIFNKLNE